MSTTPPPSPAGITDEAAFVARLRSLRTWSGHSFRELDRRARAAGDVLPYSTAATMLAKNRLPRADLLAAFVRACGVDDAELREWTAVRTAIADGTAAVPARRRAAFWRRPAVAAVAGALAGAALFAVVSGDPGTVEEEETTVVVAP